MSKKRLSAEPSVTREPAQPPVESLKEIYTRRFTEKDAADKDLIWQEIASFPQKYVSSVARDVQNLAGNISQVCRPPPTCRNIPDEIFFPARTLTWCL